MQDSNKSKGSDANGGQATEQKENLKRRSVESGPPSPPSHSKLI